MEVADRLMGEVEDRARRIRAAAVVLSTGPDMAAAQHLSERRGYRSTPERDWATEAAGLLAYRVALSRAHAGSMADSSAGAAAGGGAIYGLGIFGAVVFFWQQADAWWEYLFAIVQGLFWPAFMVYQVFAALE